MEKKISKDDEKLLTTKRMEKTMDIKMEEIQDGGNGGWGAICKDVKL